MQHITPNSKRWDYSDIPGGSHGQIKGPAHMVEGGHHPRNRSPTLGTTSVDFYHYPVTVWAYSTLQPNTEVPAPTGGHLGGEDKNKTSWNTYVVISIKRYCQCVFDRIRKLFSETSFPCACWKFAHLKSQPYLPRDNATRNASLGQHIDVDIASHYQSQCWPCSILPLGHNGLN